MTAKKCSGDRLALVHFACMLAGSSGMQLISSSAVASNKSSTSRFSTCTCQFSIDNFVDLVYVDQSYSPSDVTGSVTGGELGSWSDAKSLSFDCESATLLAIKGSDAESGCTTGGFGMRCESTDPSSPWHYLISDASWKVWGTTCQGGTCSTQGSSFTSTPGGWYQQIFRDVDWEDASLGMPTGLGGSRVSTCSTSGPAWLFRSPHLGASWFLLQFGDIEGGGCASFASYCTSSACTGDDYTDLRLAACDKTDPYQLFKFEDGRLVSAAPGYRCLYMGTSSVDTNGEPYTLASCDWTDTRQEFATESFDGSTVWRNTATSRAMDNENGDNVVGNKIMGFTGTSNQMKFNPIPAKEYVVTRRVKAGTDARTVCGSFGTLAMPKTAEEQAALEADLAAYSGTTPLAYLGGQYTPGGWMWDDGTAVTYANWAGGTEPTSFPWLCVNTRTFLWGNCKDNEFYAAVCDTGNPLSTTEAPTASPTMSPTASPTASPTTASPTVSPTAEVTVLGDPHVKNLQGHRFDMHKPGPVLLLQIPKGGPTEGSQSLLRIDANARQVDGNCGPMYLDAVNITGTWAFAKQTAGFHVTVEAERTNIRHQRHKQHFVLGPGIHVVVSHALTDTGIAFINLRVSALSKAQMPVGGLLGEDDDASTEAVPRECQKQMSLLATEQILSSTMSSGEQVD